MVTRARFERATPSFGGWCSIQLSYRARTARAFKKIWPRRSRKPDIFEHHRGEKKKIAETGLRPLSRSF